MHAMKRVIENPPSPPQEVTITMNLEEAGILRHITRNIGGIGPRRDVIDAISLALDDAGVGPYCPSVPDTGAYIGNWNLPA